MKFIEALLGMPRTHQYLTWIVTGMTSSMQQNGRREARLTVVHPNPILDKQMELDVGFDEWDERVTQFFRPVSMIGRFKTLADLLCPAGCPAGCLSVIEECLL